MVFGMVKKEEYDKVVKANNELRVKMEKLRLKNALLKDQIRALGSLPPKASSLYIFIQQKRNVSLKEIREDEKFSSVSGEDINKEIESLLKKKLIEMTVKDGEKRFSVKTPNLSG